MNGTCFACDSPDTTLEHVPPACLFPESKDTQGGQNLRRNLITVPACVDHNLVKSCDDTYFLWVLSTNLSANSVARQQVATKLKRTNERRPALGKAILRATKDVTVIDSASGIEHDAVEVPLAGCGKTRRAGDRNLPRSLSSRFEGHPSGAPSHCGSPLRATGRVATRSAHVAASTRLRIRIRL